MEYTVWILSFFLVSGDMRAGDAVQTVDNIASYKDCMELGRQMSNRYSQSEGKTYGSHAEFGCMKVKKR